MGEGGDRRESHASGARGRCFARYSTMQLSLCRALMLHTVTSATKHIHACRVKGEWARVVSARSLRQWIAGTACATLVRRPAAWDMPRLRRQRHQPAL